MKYFRLNHKDATRAMERVWAAQDALQVPHSYFHTSAQGMDASVWTEDKNGEEIFRQTLNAAHALYEQGDQQQVHTWLDAFTR